MPHNPEAFADMVVMTIKASLAPVLERIALAEKANSDLLARLQTVERFDRRLTEIQIKQDVKAAETASVLTSVADLSKDLTAVRERVAVVEVRSPIPGPAGSDGKDGKDGVNGSDGFHGKDGLPGAPGANGKDGVDGKPGSDGKDGVGFDDLSVEFDGDRTIELKFQRGLNVKTFPIVLPYMRQQGVFIDGRSYTKGDVVTWGGSQWHCNHETTTKPGEDTKAWMLVVKRGRDGKDGKDAPSVPVVGLK